MGINWDKGFPVSGGIDNTRWDRGLPYIYREYVFAGGITSFNTMSGSPTGWIWDKVTINIGTAPRSKTANSLGWSWGVVTGDSSTYIPSGNSTWWNWCLENK
jgi:hypothetical protein